MVAKAVEETALSGRQGEGQASKKEHMEHLRVNAMVQRRGATQKCESCKRTTLGPEEGTGTRRETRPHGDAHEEVVGFLGGLPLPTVMTHWPRHPCLAIDLWPQVHLANDAQDCHFVSTLNMVCLVGVSQSHHVQHVTPTRPKGNVSASVCAPQTQAAHHQWLAMPHLSPETVVCKSCSKHLLMLSSC